MSIQNIKIHTITNSLGSVKRLFDHSENWTFYLKFAKYCDDFTFGEKVGEKTNQQK